MGIHKEVTFAVCPISDAMFETMKGITFWENPWITREDLRYLKVGHCGFDRMDHQGELVVHKVIAEEVLEIFRELFQRRYPIEKMRLMDVYGGDDNSSMEDNNSSAFNYRLIAGTNRLSKHGFGMAIDINPRYNPYIRPDGTGGVIVEPKGSEEYLNRSEKNPYFIKEGDLCLKLFRKHGYTWGGDWTTVKDYQHFQKNQEGILQSLEVLQ